VSLGHETLDRDLIQELADVAFRLSAHFVASERWDDALYWACLAGRIATRVQAD
jgi:hypothetical protein